MPNQDNLKIVSKSYETCRNKKDFIEDFYDFFITSDPRIPEKFHGTNFERQIQMLGDSLFHSLNFAKDQTDYLATLEKVAERHAKNDLNIEPDLYKHWLSSMIQAVKKHDPEFNKDLELAWREALDPVIKLFIKKYE